MTEEGPDMTEGDGKATSLLPLPLEEDAKDKKAPMDTAFNTLLSNFVAEKPQTVA